MDPATAVSTFSTLVTSIELATKVRKRGVIRFLNKYFRRKIKVLVYGDSGVGKTQFLNTLTGKNVYSTNRTRVVQKYHLTLSSGRVIEFLDTPGHKTNVLVRNSTLDDMTRGRIDGIINLVDYGYQDSDELQTDPSKAFNAGTDDVKDSFLRDNRLLEIKRTEEFLNRITPGVKVDWIITVINKADIWYADKEKVYKYYTEGTYGKKVSELSHSVKLYTVPFCSVITPFANRRMQLIFSDRDKKSMFDTLTFHIESIL